MKSPPLNDDLRRWADGWKLAGEFLEEARRLDLAALDDAAGQRLVRLPSPDAPLPPRRGIGSGLVEQQRLFRRLAPK